MNKYRTFSFQTDLPFRDVMAAFRIPFRSFSSQEGGRERREKAKEGRGVRSEALTRAAELKR